MSIQNNTLRRLAAGVGAAALALVGVVGVGTAASAESTPAPGEPIPGNIKPDQEGSIIIHKHVDKASEDYKPEGDPLEGVEFRVTEVLYNDVSVELATSEGWKAIEGLTPEDVDAEDGGFTRAASSSEVTTNEDGEATASGLRVGVYLVEEIGSGPNLITSPAAPFLVTIPYPRITGWDYDVDVYPKNELGSVLPTKTVGTPDEAADVELGAVVPFTINVPVDQPALPYVSFSIEDALSEGLEFVSWGAITIGAGDPLEVGEDYTVSDDNTTVTFTETGIAALNAATEEGETMVTAVINAEVTDLGQLENKASATINGEPGETPEVTTNWARLDITKEDSANSNTLLAGATFELYAEDKTTLLATGTTNGDGELSFVVWIGNDTVTTKDVFLKETVAPQGYVLPADPWTGPITLTADATAEASVVARTITNYEPEGPGLPLTGAQGTMVMTLGGLLLVGAGAGALVVSRRRSEA